MTQEEKAGQIFEHMIPSLTVEEKELILRQTFCEVYRKGEDIFAKGDQPKGLIFLMSGKVKVYVEGVAMREQIVRLVKPSSLLGFRALFAEECHSAWAKAIEASEVCYVSKDCIRDVMATNIELTMYILKTMASSLGFSDNRTTSLTQKHIRARLADGLLLMVNTYGLESDGLTIKAYLPREDMAALSNMTTANAIRTLHVFQEEGIVKLERRKIMLLDQPALKKISELG
ncbi:MAG: Crp/Fnr family transcriptional regulator [Prevotellaceae bacterium]|jgi:CRP-like cAMP-binding protein|nr:Crp/Fnr family transcriptional regulator [Prevotellaceae bacterium]